jgi:hypothetical protein
MPNNYLALIQCHPCVHICINIYIQKRQIVTSLSFSASPVLCVCVRACACACAGLLLLFLPRKHNKKKFKKEIRRIKRQRNIFPLFFELHKLHNPLLPSCPPPRPVRTQNPPSPRANSKPLHPFLKPKSMAPYITAQKPAHRAVFKMLLTMG